MCGGAPSFIKVILSRQLQMGYNRSYKHPVVSVGLLDAYHTAIASSLFKKERSKKELGCESALNCNFRSVEWNLLEDARVFRVPNDTVMDVQCSTEVEIGVITPQNLPFPRSIHFKKEVLRSFASLCWWPATVEYDWFCKEKQCAIFLSTFHTVFPHPTHQMYMYTNTARGALLYHTTLSIESSTTAAQNLQRHLKEPALVLDPVELQDV